MPPQGAQGASPSGRADCHAPPVPEAPRFVRGGGKMLRGLRGVRPVQLELPQRDPRENRAGPAADLRVGSQRGLQERFAFVVTPEAGRRVSEVLQTGGLTVAVADLPPDLQ